MLMQVKGLQLSSRALIWLALITLSIFVLSGIFKKPSQTANHSGIHVTVYETLEDARNAVMQKPESSGQQPLVSVLTYVYCTPENNRLPLLLEAIASVRNQDFGSYEHVIIDDGSTIDLPRSLAVLHDPHVRLFRKPNSGIILSTVTYNLAFKVARGKYFILLPSDDLSFPGTLNRMTNFLEANPDHVAAVGASLNTIGWIPKGVYMHEQKWLTLESLTERSRIHDCTIMVRASALQQIELPPDIVGEAADWDTWLRLREIGTFGLTNEMTVIYRDQPDATRHFRKLSAEALEIISQDRHFKYLTASAHKRQQRKAGYSLQENDVLRLLIATSEAYFPRSQAQLWSAGSISVSEMCGRVGVDAKLFLFPFEGDFNASAINSLLQWADVIWMEDGGGSKLAASEYIARVVPFTKKTVLHLRQPDSKADWPRRMNLGNLDYIIFESVEMQRFFLPHLRISGRSAPIARVMPQLASSRFDGAQFIWELHSLLCENISDNKVA